MRQAEQSRTPLKLYRTGEQNFISEQNSSFNTRYEFSGKEKDMATGYNYFGARYYNSDISVWLSVDPMSDERPGLSPYHYCSWNPVMLVDPDGMLEDWFENELTGDIYYNPNMQKGDEGTGAMTGEGWVHMGEDDMLGEMGGMVVFKNQDKASSISFEQVDVENSDYPITERAGYFEYENAKEIMASYGYDFKPTEVEISRSTESYSFSDGRSQYSHTYIDEYQHGTKGKYVRSNYQPYVKNELENTPIMSGYSSTPNRSTDKHHIVQEWGYAKPNHAVNTLKVMEKIFLGMHGIHSSTIIHEHNNWD